VDVVGLSVLACCSRLGPPSEVDSRQHVYDQAPLSGQMFRR
jgi:hypothetical protein